MSRFLSVALIAGLALAMPVRVFAQPPNLPPLTPAGNATDVDTPQAKPARPGAPAQSAPPPPPAAPQAPVAVPPPAPPGPPAPPIRAVNIQLEFTITDQTGSGAPDKKTVSMIASNGTWGRIRASATARPRQNIPVAVSLNVDSRPYLTTGDSIQTEITIEYRPVGASMADEPARVDPTILNQSLTVVLQSGKSMVISQAADPITDRKIVIEAKATVLK